MDATNVIINFINMPVLSQKVVVLKGKEEK